jgi:hypothetical protein
LERRKTSECFLCASVIGNRADRRRRFVEVEKWRKEFEVDKLVEEFEYTEKDKVFEYYPQYYHKTDKVRYVWKLAYSAARCSGVRRSTQPQQAA